MTPKQRAEEIVKWFVNHDSVAPLCDLASEIEMALKEKTIEMPSEVDFTKWFNGFTDYEGYDVEPTAWDSYSWMCDEIEKRNGGKE